MRSVSHFEYDLLTILHSFFYRGSASHARLILEGKCAAPRCLKKEAVELVQDTLAKGCVRVLAHADGWKRERFLRGESAAEGRLWERTPPGELGLRFSANTLDFLIWCVSVNVSDAKSPVWKPRDGEPLTTGDLFFFYLAYESIRETSMAPLWRRRSPFHQHGLCWLACADDYSQPLIDVEPDFTPWLTGAGACILEALQSRLAERWRQMELNKERIINVDQMRKLGQVQQRALDRFLSGADRHRRRDLTRFLLSAARRLLSDPPPAENWVRRLNVRNLRLADRMDAYRSAGAFLDSFTRLRSWQDESRGIGYIDEGYAAAQLYQAHWEQLHGDALCDTAQQIRQQLEPLNQATAARAEPTATGGATPL